VSRAFRIALLATSLIVVEGCAHKRPYKLGQGPEQDDLLALTKPQIDAIQVSSAKVVLNRAQRGNLAFIAQTPGRFRGGVTFNGSELVTLAFHEEGYELRYKLDEAFAPGYYKGPPDGCAVEALLGISMQTDSLVALMLGGAPVIDAPYEVMGQKWSRKRGWELVLLRNDKYIQELRFDIVDGSWQFVGGEMWERNGDEKGRRLWEVEHRSLAGEGAAVLPERTRVSTPGRRRDNLVTIIYKERNLDPAFAKQSGDGGGDGGDGGEGGDDGWDDAGDDGWDDGGGDDGWENEPGSEAGAEDGGWENDPAPEAAADDAWENEPTPETGEASGPPEPAPEAAPAPKPEPKPEPTERTIPEVFHLVPGALQERGDLCR